jgi:hypothetical protein
MMHYDWQDFAAIALAIAASLYMIRRLWPRNLVPGDGKISVCANCFSASRGRGCTIAAAGRTRSPGRRASR